MTSEGAADQPFARTWQEAMDVYRFVLHPSIQCDLSMHLKLPGDDDQYDSDEDDHKQERKVEGAIQPSPNLYAKLKRGRMERQSFVTGCRHGEMPRNVDIACVAMQHTFVMHNFSFPDDHTPDARRNNPNLDRIMKCLEGAIPHGCSLHFMRLHQPNPELAVRIWGNQMYFLAIRRRIGPESDELFPMVISPHMTNDELLQQIRLPLAALRVGR